MHSSFFPIQIATNVISIMEAVTEQMVGVSILLVASTVNVMRDTIYKRITNSFAKVSSVMSTTDTNHA